MTIAIFEPHASGHRAGYVRWIAEGLRSAGRSVLIGGSSELFAHPAMKELRGSAGVQTVQLQAPAVAGGGESGRLKSISQQLAYRNYFSRLYARSLQCGDIRGVVVPYLDYCLYAIAALGTPFAKTPWCGITMRSGFNEPRGGLNLQSAGLGLLRNSSSLRAVFSIDPRIQYQPSASSQSARVPLRYIADPVVLLESGDRARMRATFGIADSIRVVTVFGTLDRRKGIACLLEGLLCAGSDIPLKVLLAGKQASGTRALLAEPRYRPLASDQRIGIIDRYVDDTELADLLAGSDAVWLGYVGHKHMSGVFLLAAVSGVPIIATHDGVIGFLAGQSSLTYTLDPEKSLEVAAALRELVKAPHLRRSAEERSRIAAAHSPRKFGADIAAVFG